MVGRPHGRERGDAPSGGGTRVVEVHLLSEEAVDPDLVEDPRRASVRVVDEQRAVERMGARPHLVEAHSDADEGAPQGVHPDAGRDLPEDQAAVALRLVVGDEISPKAADRPVRAERPAGLAVRLPDPDLRHEAVVRPEPVAVIVVLREEVERPRRVLPPDQAGVARHSLAGPLVGEIRALRGLRAREEELPGDRVLVRQAPAEVGPEDAVVSAAVGLADLPIGCEEADERLAELLSHAADGHDRAELLVGEVRRVRAGEDDAAPAAVLDDERGVRGVLDLAGGADAPAGRRDGPCVDRLDRGREELDPLQEERPLLRKEEREALVGADLRHV